VRIEPSNNPRVHIDRVRPTANPVGFTYVLGLLYLLPKPSQKDEDLVGKKREMLEAVRI
jgi:hypothetical protein